MGSATDSELLCGEAKTNGMKVLGSTAEGREPAHMFGWSTLGMMASSAMTLCTDLELCTGKTAIGTEGIG